MISGIYKIINVFNGMVYIGSSKDVKKRWREHKFNLRKGSHCNPYLQNSWNKYGEANFHFEKLEDVAEDSLLVSEQEWLEYTMCYERQYGFNICSVAGRTTGVPMPQHVKSALLEVNKGREPWNKGRKNHKAPIVNLSEEKRRKISETLRKECSGSRTKLNWAIVREIRERFSDGLTHKAELAREYDVDRSQISRIISCQTWREVEKE